MFSDQRTLTGIVGRHAGDVIDSNSLRFFGGQSVGERDEEHGRFAANTIDYGLEQGNWQVLNDFSVILVAIQFRQCRHLVYKIVLRYEVRRSISLHTRWRHHVTRIASYKLTSMFLSYGFNFNMIGDSFISQICLCTLISEPLGASPVVYQPMKSMSLNTCLTETNLRLIKDRIFLWKCTLFFLHVVILSIYDNIAFNFVVNQFEAVHYFDIPALLFTNQRSNN